jgi:hypothetical protein
MKMVELVALVDTVKSKWQTNVVQGRPGEVAQLQVYLGSAATYASVLQQLENWKASLRTLSNKPRVSASISKPLVQATFQCFTSLSTALDHAGNGVDWICTQRNFSSNYTMAVILIREITSDSAKEATAIVDAAKERLENDLAAIQNGSAAATEFLQSNDGIVKQIEILESASTTIAEQVATIQKATESGKSDIAQMLAEVDDLKDESSESINESLAEYQEALKTAQTEISKAEELKTKAQALVDAATKANVTAAEKNDAALTSLAEATQKQIATAERLTKALQSAQMEGLAGSFTKKAEEAKIDIEKEQKRFEMALVYLAAIGLLSLVIELTVGFPKTTEEFYFRLIRTFSLAAPGIWIAWSAARRLSALNRVFTDYQYKSASALAYESYRQTVAEASDDALKNQLLAFAIRSFGDNPTRYYDSAQNDPSSPTDSWLGKLIPQKKNTGIQ